jgi:hypothetical protein
VESRRNSGFKNPEKWKNPCKIKGLEPAETVEVGFERNLQELFRLFYI